MVNYKENFPITLNRNFRSDLVSNFKKLNNEKSANKEALLNHATNQKNAHTSNQINHNGMPLYKVVEQLKSSVNEQIIGANGNGNAEIKDIRIDSDGNRHELAQQRLLSEFAKNNEIANNALDLSNEHEEELKNSAYYNEVEVINGRKFDTDYNIVRIPHRDENGELIKLKRGFYTNNHDDLIFATPRQFAKENNATFVANASTFTNDGKLHGRQIHNGKIIETAYDKNVETRWTLVFNEDNTLESYPPEVTTKELLDKGIKNALTAFGPIIVDGKRFYKPGDYATNSEINNPRMVIGQLPNKDLIFFSCDGRVKGEYTHQTGMKLGQVVDTLFSHFGDIDFAYNLDGGGSTSSVVRSTMINAPKDKGNKYEREVLDFFYIDKPLRQVRDVDIQKAYEDIGDVKARQDLLHGLVTNFNTVNDKNLFLTGLDNYTGFVVNDENGKPKKKLYITKTNFGLWDYDKKAYDFIVRDTGTWFKGRNLFLTGLDKYTGIVINDNNGKAKKKLYITPDNFGLWDYDKKQYDFIVRPEGLFYKNRLTARHFANPEKVDNCNNIQHTGSYYATSEAIGSPYPNVSRSIIKHYNIDGETFSESTVAFQESVPFAHDAGLKGKRRSFYNNSWSQWYDL
ncbi:phosphodiester glycosidase family protein [Staphylococcus nepalensis]|uniref:phosphodiester glycosidase family protein n=1 Tax=Staphylococcus nepalensis TaxID=214473 RepID=UPI003EE7532F